MVIKPRDTGEIYESVRDELTSRITKVTNFVSGSFNNAFLASHSEQIREAEIKALAGELAGLVDYAGKDLTQADLNRLGIENVDPERINEYMEESQLDRLAANYTIQRDPGTPATGNVILETSSPTTIQNGMSVGTEPDATGEYTKYFVFEGDLNEFDPDSSESISLEEGENELQIVSEDVGTEYNVGPSTVTYIPNPQPSIQSVNNIDPVDGAEDEEETEALRSRVKDSIFDSADGGTKPGMESYIEENSSSPVDVNIDEFKDQKPPFVDVVIDGGDDQELEELIEESRSVGIRHNLARPNEISFGVFATLVGEDIDTDIVENEIDSYIASIGLSESFSFSSLLNKIISSQKEVESVPALNTYYTTVTNESNVFDNTQNVYEINQGPLGRVNTEEHGIEETKTEFGLLFGNVDESTVSVEAIVDDERVDLVKDTDYTVEDSDGDGELDTISLDGVSPDQGTTLLVTYVHDSVGIDSVEDADGNVYQEDADYGLIDDDGDNIPDSIDWSVGGDSPSDGIRFDISYTVRRSFEGDKFADDRQLYSPDLIRIETQ